jgi:hypothetical protein
MVEPFRRDVHRADERGPRRKDVAPKSGVVTAERVPAGHSRDGSWRNTRPAACGRLQRPSTKRRTGLRRRWRRRARNRPGRSGAARAPAFLAGASAMRRRASSAVRPRASSCASSSRTVSEQFSTLTPFDLCLAAPRWGVSACHMESASAPRKPRASSLGSPRAVHRFAPLRGASLLVPI